MVIILVYKDFDCESIRTFGKRRRARKMLGDFERILSEVEVVDSETEVDPNKIALVYAFPSMGVNSQ